MNTLRASYLAVEQLVQNMWVNAQQQMESLTSCRFFIYSVALLSSGSGTRSVAVTFSYVTQTGRNTTTDTKVLTFTTGISMTTNSSLSYSVASLFVNSQSYTITLAVPNGCSLTSFSFDTLLVDQTAMQSPFNSFVDMG